MLDDQPSQDIRSAFQAVASHEGTAPGQETIARIKRAGRGMKMRRWALKGASVVAVASAAAIAVVATQAPRTAPVASPAASPSAGLAGSATTPKAPPTNLNRATLEEISAKLRVALVQHLPAGVAKVSAGLGPFDFKVTRTDGTQFYLAFLTGKWSLKPQSSACATGFGIHCHKVVLSDSSQGWVWDGKVGGFTELDATTVQGWSIGLNSDTHDSGLVGPSRPLAQSQLVALANTPAVLAAMELVPTDQPK
jgi:hypothetical protein